MANHIEDLEARARMRVAAELAAATETPRVTFAETPAPTKHRQDNQTEDS